VEPAKKGGGTLKGVKARFDAVLVQVGRTGEVIGTCTDEVAAPCPTGA